MSKSRWLRIPWVNHGFALTLTGENPNRLAVEYYFGHLQYWNLPRIVAYALEQGYDGPALRHLAGMLNPVESDMRTEVIDRAFRKMSVDAPVSKENARLFLATESAQKTLNGQSNIFDEATYIRISLYELSDPPDTLNSPFAHPRRHSEELQNNYNARRS